MFKWINKLFKRSLENPSVPFTWENVNEVASGVQVGEANALTLSTVWRAVSLISRDVAKLPLCVYRQVGEGKDKAKEHPAYRLLHDSPNSECTAFIFWQVVVTQLLLQGNSYVYCFRKGSGQPDELAILSPYDTYPVRENGALLYVTKVGMETRKLPAEDVLHFRGIGDDLQGWSCIQKAAESIGLGIALQKYSSKFFANGAAPLVVLEHPAVLNDTARENLRREWNKLHSGLDGAFKTAVLQEGMKANAFSFNPRDAQLLEAKNWSIVDVANWFNLPPHKLGDATRTSYNSLEMEQQAYLDGCLDPILVCIEQECRRRLLSEVEKTSYSHTIEFNRNAMVRANLTERMNAYKVGIDARILLPNEARARENLPPLPGGDEFLIKEYDRPLDKGSDGIPQQQKSDKPK